MSDSIGILNYSKNQLIQLFDNINVPKFRVAQVLEWIYNIGCKSFNYMNNIGKELINILNENYYIYRPTIVKTNKSIDGTIKFLLQLKDNNTIETVFIPEKNRNTICISSQVGCAVGCKFCNTGYNGFKRNLTVEEIVSQVLIIKDYLNSWKIKENSITNIVVMGMGEPLFNWNNIGIALENLQIGKNHKISTKHITVSTSGIVPVLNKIINKFDYNLAISLHAPSDEIRSNIMPINNLYPLSDLLNTCKVYNNLNNKLITFEYLMLDGINDSEKNAKQLIKLLHGIKYKINLIKFNAWEGDIYVGSSMNKIEQFRNILNKSGVTATIRCSKGQDIMAACGQLQSQKYNVLQIK